MERFAERFDFAKVLTLDGRAVEIVQVIERPDFVSGRELVEAERFTAVSADGSEVDAWLVRPADFEIGLSLGGAVGVSYQLSCPPPNGGQDPGTGGSATPELDSIILFGLGALGLAGMAWRQRRQFHRAASHLPPRVHPQG